MTLLKLKQPLAIFDVEATGTNVCSDRIVEIFVLKILPDGTEEKFHSRYNPEIPIPPEVTLIHGLSDADVKNEPKFSEKAVELQKFLKKCDLAGFNHIKFDIPILVEEFLRCDIEFELGSRKLLDAQKIFHLMEKRTLSAAYQFYCQKELVDAHSAEADTRATLEVLEAQLRKYDGQDVEDAGGNVIGQVKPDAEAIHNVFNQQMVDLAGRFVYNQDGVEVLNFGKHRFKPVSEVLKREPGFYDWMMRGEFPLDTKRKLTEIRLRHFNNR
jgi:DNA polymerase-3 subunit epsilon